MLVNDINYNLSLEIEEKHNFWERSKDTPKGFRGMFENEDFGTPKERSDEPSKTLSEQEFHGFKGFSTVRTRTLFFLLFTNEEEEEEGDGNIVISKKK